MPILHVQYDKGQTLDGKVVSIPPAIALSQTGPVVQAVLGLAQSFTDQLLKKDILFPSL